ncbi:hypothetical protein ACE10Z_19800 [Bradyrhizobium sp. Pha-3]|uniref:hypothetical protein n=1 Tax=Bradyrhizobium sp. Pha-3 TaxID=208375 RepID=UPI0035D486D5
MSLRQFAALAALISLTICTGTASATMPNLSQKPSQPSQATCLKWAQSQNSDALETWGTAEDGTSSRDVGVMRLTLYCLGDGVPVIVGATSSAGAMAAYCTEHASAGICGRHVKQATGFVFSPDGMTNAAESAETVRLGEKLTADALRRRFPGYKVRVAKGEDCLVCASVEGPAGSFGLDWTENGRTVTGLYTYDKGASDAFGNRNGGSLRDAVGARAVCDNGLEFGCESPKAKGFWYVVEENEKCSFAAETDKPVSIPACARIGGIRIYRPK